MVDNFSVLLDGLDRARELLTSGEAADSRLALWYLDEARAAAATLSKRAGLQAPCEELAQDTNDFSGLGMFLGLLHRGKEGDLEELERLTTQFKPDCREVAI